MNALEKIVACADRRGVPRARMLFVVETLEGVWTLIGKKKSLLGHELCEKFTVAVVQQYGRLAGAVLREFGIVESSDLGIVIWSLIADDLLTTTGVDKPSDFHNLPSLVVEADRASANRLLQELAEVR